jgi:hypothetical protein
VERCGKGLCLLGRDFSTAFGSGTGFGSGTRNAIVRIVRMKYLSCKGIHSQHTSGCVALASLSIINEEGIRAAANRESCAGLRVGASRNVKEGCFRRNVRL